MVIQNLYSDDNTLTIIPSWASNKEAIAKISTHQQQKINPDAIFGRIDARNFKLDLS
jgi:Inner centromere protein, ARK binding region